MFRKTTKHFPRKTKIYDTKPFFIVKLRFVTSFGVQTAIHWYYLFWIMKNYKFASGSTCSFVYIQMKFFKYFEICNIDIDLMFYHIVQNKIKQTRNICYFFKLIVRNSLLMCKTCSHCLFHFMLHMMSSIISLA